MNPPNLPIGKPYSFLMNKARPVSGQNSLKVNKESRKITKNAPLPKPQNSIKQTVEPRIFYDVPQRVIHITPQNFKDVVQSLTGIEKPTGVSEVSPAARLASTERRRPVKKERPSWSNGEDDMMKMFDNGVQMSQFPGLLLPEPAILPPLPYENFLPPVLPQQYNNFLPPKLPPLQYNNFLPPTLPQIQYNNFLPATLPPITSANSNLGPLPLTRSEIFSRVNLLPIPSDTFLRDTWQQKPSDIFSPVTLPQSHIFSPGILPQSDIFSPGSLPPTQPDNFLLDNWQPSDILKPPVTLPLTKSDNFLPNNWQPSDILFPPVTLPRTKSDNFLLDNWQPSDILLADTWQPSDNLSPVTLPSTQSDICSPDTWQPSDILSADTWEPLDIQSPPSTQSDTLSTYPRQPIQPDIYSPGALPQTPSDTWLSSNTFSPETLQPKPNEAFSPVLGRQSQTVLSYDDTWPENNILAKPPESFPLRLRTTSPADIVLRQTPSNQFNHFHYA